MAGVGMTISGQDSRDSLSAKIRVNPDLSEMREQATQSVWKDECRWKGRQGQWPSGRNELDKPKEQKKTSVARVTEESTKMRLGDMQTTL